jgi:hypothetical protein
MSERRRAAVERIEAGPVFADSMVASDGTFCWLTISELFYLSFLDGVSWRSDRTPGARLSRSFTEPGGRKRVVVRLRGIQPHELGETVSRGRLVIGEFWPNNRREHFRGINFVSSDRSRWRQDLVPTSDTVYCLTLRSGQMWLEVAGLLSAFIGSSGADRGGVA